MDDNNAILFLLEIKATAAYKSQVLMGILCDKTTNGHATDIHLSLWW